MKIRNVYYALLAILVAGLFSSCEKEAKTPYETGEKLISMVAEGGSNEIEIIVDPAKQNSVSLQAEIDQLSAYGIVVAVEPSSNLVAEYNKERGTDYQEIPASAYDIKVSDFIFPKYAATSSHVNISFTSADLQGETTYLLPIQMKAVRGDDNASIDPTKDVIYLIIKRLPPPKLVHLTDVELTTEIGPGKKNWFAAYATAKDGTHIFTVEEAAEQSEMMDFAAVKHGKNLRFHPSIIGWQHGGDYHRYIYPYTIGFEKLNHTANLNRTFGKELFDRVNTAEELVGAIAYLDANDSYNFYATDRMTTKDLQKLDENNRVLISAWSPTIGKTQQFMLIYLKEINTLAGGHFAVKMDIKYIETDVRTEFANTPGQNVTIDNPAYVASSEIEEFKGITLTTEIGAGQKNWFAAYATSDDGSHAFTVEEAAKQSEMMDFAAILYDDADVRLYTAYIGYKHPTYKDRIAPYTQGFSKLTYLMMGGLGAGSSYATQPEHYAQVKDVKSLTDLVLSYSYSYARADRMTTDKLHQDAVGIIGWGSKVGVNQSYGIYIVRVLEPTSNGHYRITLDIKVPKSNVRTPNNSSSVVNPD
ncbi:MAG: DUF1735 domain-containing protein [Porphyromonas sp.]|nr:DUF1735 domain-containing protein [Porphyromonas sp.]